MTNTPFNNLDPDLILGAVESVKYQCTGSLSALNSFENRVYQIGIEDQEPIIAKFYRPNRWTNEAIIEEHAFALALHDQEIPVVAPLRDMNGETLHTYQEYRFALFPRHGGRTLELDNEEQLEWMGRFLGRIHAIGAIQPFTHRMSLDVQSYGFKPYQYLLENNFIPPAIRNNYMDAVESILEKVSQRFADIDNLRRIRLHGDFHLGNILWNLNGPHIVDLDDCLMGPAVQDFWMLLSGATVADSKLQLQCLLDGYREFFDFDNQEIYLIEALRALRMIHYTGWLAKRWDDPAFPLNFPWFNTAKYWDEHLQHLRDQSHHLDQA